MQEVCKYGIIKDCGLLVNSSRGIIFASDGVDFAAAAAAKAHDLQKENGRRIIKTCLRSTI